MKMRSEKDEMKRTKKGEKIATENTSGYERKKKGQKEGRLEIQEKQN